MFWKVSARKNLQTQETTIPEFGCGGYFFLCLFVFLNFVLLYFVLFCLFVFVVFSLKQIVFEIRVLGKGL